MRTRLVSFLGLGPMEASAPYYSPTKYELGGVRTKEETPLIEAALSELFEIDSVVVLGTEKVRERWFDGDNLFREYFGRDESTFIQIDSATDAKGRWKIFQETVKALTEQSLAIADETERPDQIVLDVTHGFRAQPLFGMAAVSFVLSEWSRKGVEASPSLRILYGAFEDRDQENNITQIWDLTEFVLSARWNAALDAFLRFGRADDVAQLAGLDKSAETARLRAEGCCGKELQPASFSGKLGQAAQRFADDLATGRLQSVIAGRGKQQGTAAILLGLLGSPEKQTFIERVPLLEEPLKQLEQRLEPLVADATLSSDGVRAAAALATLYGELERYAEQAALVRETAVSATALACGLPTVEPGQQGCQAARAEAESVLNRIAKVERDSKKNNEQRQQLAPSLAAIVQLYNGARDDRNDIEHCGLRDGPRPSKKLREKIPKLATALTKALQPIGDCRFVNLSNHPLGDWSAEQIKAARQLGCGEPVDIEGGMPLVDPSRSSEDVAQLASLIVAQAIAQGAAGAFVAGELTLTYALVSRLRVQGVRCFSATTEDIAVEESKVDESVNRRAILRFVRWREYPVSV